MKQLTIQEQKKRFLKDNKSKYWDKFRKEDRNRERNDIIKGIENNPKEYKEFACNTDYPEMFNPDVYKVLSVIKNINYKNNDKIIEELKSLFNKDDYLAERIISMKKQYEESKKMKLYELDKNPDNQSHVILEILEDIKYWGFQKTELKRLLLLKGILLEKRV